MLFKVRVSYCIPGIWLMVFALCTSDSRNHILGVCNGVRFIVVIGMCVMFCVRAFARFIFAGGMAHGLLSKSVGTHTRTRGNGEVCLITTVTPMLVIGW